MQTELLSCECLVRAINGTLGVKAMVIVAVVVVVVAAVVLSPL